MKIGLISDTHGFLDDKVFHYFENCDEIWHTGDIGSLAIIEQLERFKPIKAVYGNIDGQEIRIRYPKDQRFACEGLNIWITHIGGVPPRYNKDVIKEIKSNPPDLFICGHSHILRVMNDPNNKKLLYINPGAAGNQGFHKIKTVVRFEITDKIIQNVQAIELGKRG